MPRVILVLPTRTYRAAAFLRASEQLGLDVITASEAAPSLAALRPGHSLVVHLAQSAGDAPEVSLEGLGPVDGVVGVDEAAVVVAARIAERLGVPRANPVDAAAATRDKRLLRGRLAAANVAQPRWVEIAGDAEGRDARPAVAAVGLPCVVKPVHLAASRGVIRADSEAALAGAIRRVDALLRSPELCGPDGAPPLLVEEYVPGAEIVVEGLVSDGHLDVLAVLDKPDPLEGPFFEETLFITPSRHDPDVVEAATRTAAAAVAALGLRHGPVHAELRLGPAGPILIEVASRSIGGRCSTALQFRSDATGEAEIGLEEVILRHACGLELGSVRLVDGASGALMLPIRRAGVLRGVEGLGAARRVPGIVAVDIAVPAGERVTPLPEGDRYLGFVVAHAADPAAAEAALRQAGELLQPVIEPLAASPREAA
jgi:biotin carboxylase